jgi:hypothetical protein
VYGELDEDRVDRFPAWWWHLDLRYDTMPSTTGEKKARPFIRSLACFRFAMVSVLFMLRVQLVQFTRIPRTCRRVLPSFCLGFSFSVSSPCALRPSYPLCL